MKRRALLLVIILLLAIVPAMVPTSGEGEETRSPGWVGVKLYAQISTTETTLSTVQSSNRYRASDDLTFESIELEETLVVMGVDTGVGLNLGLKAQIGVQATLATEVTVSALDDGDAIASKTITVPSGETQYDWEMPFTSDRDTYTFNRRHVISLRIEADRPVGIRTNSNSYLELFCEDHLSITVETRDVDDNRASTFFPNDLAENRHVFIEGDITNPFGSDDLTGVNISIRRPNGQYVVEDDPASVSPDLNYTYDWNYATGLPSGLYNINATGQDLQGNEFSSIGSFMMAEYGIRISAEDEEGGVVTGSTTPGSPAKYTLTILNIGGNRADIVMADGDPLPLWQTSFSKTSFNLDAGDDTDITFDVQPSSTLGGGNSSLYIVTATVNNDPSIPKARDSLQVETFVRNEVDLTVLPVNPDPKTIGVGGTVDHTFTIRNMGEFTTTVDLSKTGVPTGWQAVFAGNRVVDNSIEDLRQMEIVDVVLKVTAPETSDIMRATINVRFQSSDFPDVYEDRTTVTNMVIGLRLNPTSPTNSTLDPGDNFNIWFDALNDDPTSEHVITFSVEQHDSNWPSNSFVFSPQSPVTIGADSRQPMSIETTVPASAVAGTFQFTVKGVVDGYSDVYDSFDYNIRINLRHELVVDLSPDVNKFKISTKEESIVYLTIINNGNVVESINITIETSSSDVEVKMNDAMTSIILNMPVAPSAEEEIKISFKAKDTASHKEVINVRIEVQAASDPTPITNDLKLVVELSRGEWFADYLDWAAILIMMLVMMAGLLLYNPRKKRAQKDKGEEDKKGATHGAVARQ
jgi:uncharacterized membrane protein